MRDNEKDLAEFSAPTNFYKYAYTSLLRRYAVSSCDKVLESGESLQKDIESLLKDMQELIYNCTREEVDLMKKDLSEPTYYLQECTKSLSNALTELRSYKIKLLTAQNL